LYVTVWTQSPRGFEGPDVCVGFLTNLSPFLGIPLSFICLQENKKN